MAWPSADDYFDAMQHPARRFCRPELKRSQVGLDARGKPKVRSGQRVDVYELRGANGQDRWAIGCFTQEPQGLTRRYHFINEYLQQHPVACLVQTDYHEQGISIRGRWHPITHGRWVDGLNLNAYVAEYLDYPDELRALADVWVRMARELQLAGMAHGNLASDTVLVAPGTGGSLSLRLVDYDAIFVPALEEEVPEEMGHVDFQHPQRAWQRLYSADADNFSQLVVLTALYGLAVEGRSLWDRFDSGDNLLFHHSDFQEPATSALFRELWQSESTTVRALTGQLVLSCHDAVSEVAPLEHVAKWLRPGGARTALKDAQIDEIDKLLDFGVKRSPVVGRLDEPPPLAGSGNDDFALEIEDEPAPVAKSVDPVETAIFEGPPPLPANSPPRLPAALPPPLPTNLPPRLPAALPPPLPTNLPPRLAAALPPPLPPVAALEHPLMQSYELEAWMPEEIAVVKLQGFVKDVGGEVIRSVPGYIRVHLLDERDLAQPQVPGVLSWLGLVAESPAGPRVLAVMEMNLVHKQTPTRKLIGISLRLSPGPEDDVSPKWKKYCDKIFCDLRGYLMGFA